MVLGTNHKFLATTFLVASLYDSAQYYTVKFYNTNNYPNAHRTVNWQQ